MMIIALESRQQNESQQEAKDECQSGGYGEKEARKGMILWKKEKNLPIFSLFSHQRYSVVTLTIILVSQKNGLE